MKLPQIQYIRYLMATALLVLILNGSAPFCFGQPVHQIIEGNQRLLGGSIRCDLELRSQPASSSTQMTPPAMRCRPQHDTPGTPFAGRFEFAGEFLVPANWG